jgi:transcriptional regulator with XRE-family HTH domain/tetratricopeptide (TPR) repeat protein
MTIPNEKLQRARLEKRWSVMVASRKAGVSTNTFNRWERGLQVPQLTTLNQLMEAFALSADDLGFGFVVSPHQRPEHQLAGVNMEEESVPMSSMFSQETKQGESVSSSLRIAIASSLPPVVQDIPAQSDTEHFSRRQVIAALIGTPAAVFCARPGDTLSLLRAEEILTVCASHIPLCWQFYFEGGQAEIERVLPNYIAQLSTLTRHSSAYQKRAASLLSQAYQLASLLATQRQDYGEAASAARQGLFYGEMAEDPSLQLASHIRQALVAFYLKRPRQRLLAYQSALQLVPFSSPLLQGRTYIGLAEAYSKLGQESEAWRSLVLAQQVFPERSEDDPSYPFTHFSRTSISTFEGIMLLNLAQPERAWQTFSRIDATISTDPVPNRLELTVNQARTACILGELEATCHYLQTAVPMAHTLNSSLRLDESCSVYEDMLTKWGTEPRVSELADLFR